MISIYGKDGRHEGGGARGDLHGGRYDVPTGIQGDEACVQTYVVFGSGPPCEERQAGKGVVGQIQAAGTVRITPVNRLFASLISLLVLL